MNCSQKKLWQKASCDFKELEQNRRYFANEQFKTTSKETAPHGFQTVPIQLYLQFQECISQDKRQMCGMEPELRGRYGHKQKNHP
jgi:hypothetical protein